MQMNKEKLKIGLLIEDYNLPRWTYEMIEEIKHSDYSEISLVIKKQSTTTKKKSLIKRIYSKRRNILFYLYCKLENKLFKPVPNAFEQKNLSDLINCPEITVSTEETKFNDKILSKDINIIKTYDVDVLIRFGFRILIGEILNCSKFGIWSCHYGDNKLIRGDSAGAWELLNQWNASGITLQILTEDLGGGQTISKSFFCTNNNSINWNKNNFYWKARSLIPRKLEELYRLGEKDFFSNLSKYNKDPFLYYNRIYSTPKNLELLKAVFKIFRNYLRRKVFKIFCFEQWILLYDLTNSEKISKPLYRFKRIIPPKDRFWADPFVVNKNNKYYIFVEELVYKEKKGKISVIEMDNNGKYGDSKVVLERDYHLSYPFIFQENGQTYMIPETIQKHRIELYKCIDFPMRWELEEILIDKIEAADTTLFKYNDKYWLFTSLKPNIGTSVNDEVYLFYSDNLLKGNWKPHPQNPIISDVRCSRPAGNIFTIGNQIFRPAQNCSKHYGYGMQIREIIKLNEYEYEEKQIQSIYPNWENDLLGTHTLNLCGKLTIIDALIKRKRFI